MAETWVIKDNAPVDENSYELAKTSISFASGGAKFVALEVYTDDVVIWLKYYTSANSAIEVSSFEPGMEDKFYWQNNAYKKLTFDTPPTGALLTWLESNATRQVVEYLTTDTDLIKVANAIRAKSETTAKLSFPDGFVQAINSYTGGEEYDGDYEVTPKFTEEVLKTKNKIMKDNVLVHPIEVARVSNPSGGTTVYIGGITNG